MHDNSCNVVSVDVCVPFCQMSTTSFKSFVFLFEKLEFQGPTGPKF